MGILVIRLRLQVLIVALRVALYTLLERKLLGYIQLRKGPNKPGPSGLLVPFADAVKLFVKESNKPVGSNKLLFLTVPGLTLLIPVLLWVLYPAHNEPLAFKYSSLFFLCASAVGVYAILGAG